MPKLSQRTQHLQQSGIRAASVRCAEVGGINLGQGVCDMPTPDIIKQRASQSIEANKNLYSACEGVMPLREAIGEKLQTFNGIKNNPQSDIIITHGSTGAFVCAAMTLFNPGDEIILFEPFYGYHKNILELHGMTVKSVPIHLQDFSIDFDRLRQTIGPKTRAIVVCTPNNPSGKVYTEKELLTIGEIAREHNLWVITDEIYEYITYPGHEHVSLARLEDFAERTITISGFSKTYNMTGWRLGYATGPTAVIQKMALVQDLIYVCPATPLQHAVRAAFSLQPHYYEEMQRQYLDKRDMTVTSLSAMGFQVTVPQGAYYVLADFSALDFADDEHAAATLLSQAKVASVPGRSFYCDPNDGRHLLRLCYALNAKEVQQALEQMETVMGALS